MYTRTLFPWKTPFFFVGNYNNHPSVVKEQSVQGNIITVHPLMGGKCSYLSKFVFCVKTVSEVLLRTEKKFVGRESTRKRLQFSRRGRQTSLFELKKQNNKPTQHIGSVFHH